MGATEKIYCEATFYRKQVVEYFYNKEGHDFHKGIHKMGGTVEENIQDTLNSISPNSKMFVLRNENELCGFFVKYQDEQDRLALEGFHVDKKYRHKVFFKQFWETVREKMGDDFVVGIYEKNEPAIKHLVRQGFEFTHELVNDNKKYFIFKLKN